MELSVIVLFAISGITCVTSHGPHSGGMTDMDHRIRDALMQEARLEFLCRGGNGLLCSGHGRCSDGMCSCNTGFSGLTCQLNNADIVSPEIFANFTDLTDLPGFPSRILTPENAEESVTVTGISDNIGENLSETNPCNDFDENPCRGRGVCREGACACQAGYSGYTCELSHSVGFCRTYKDCAECLAFMVGCPNTCSTMARFNLVYDFPATTSHTFQKCRYRSSQFSCSYYFMQESEDSFGWKTIMVKPCLNYRELLNTTARTEEPLLGQRPDTRHGQTEPTTVTKPFTSSVDSSTTTSASISPTTAATTLTESEDDNKLKQPETRPGRTDKSGGQPAAGDGAASVSHSDTLVVFGTVLVLMNL